MKRSTGIFLLFLLLCITLWLCLKFFNKNTILNVDKFFNSSVPLQNEKTPAITLNISQTILRGKRYLDFTKGTRMSWRTTIKNNILRVNTLWGYGWGFRANFPFPNKEDRLRSFFKRDLLHTFTYLLDGHGLDGTACLLKLYCIRIMKPDNILKEGMLSRVMHMLLRNFREADSRQLPFLKKENCRQLLHSHCPLSFDSISSFTDD